MMDITHQLHEIWFEWDSEKATINQHKHGIRFETACEVFFDPFIRWVDEEVISGELREAVIGITVNWRLLYVIYVMREEKVRIISARPVTMTERRIYEDQ